MRDIILGPEDWKEICLSCHVAFVSVTPFLLGICTCELLTLEL